MQKFKTGPPYVFMCKPCEHYFYRSVNWGMFCPTCRSLRDMLDPRIQK